MPWSKVFNFCDPFQYQSSIRAAEVELYPTARGDFRAELTQINLHQLWMQRFDEKLPQVYAGRIRPGRRVIGFLTADDQPELQHCGVAVSPRDIVISNHEVMHHRTAGNCRYGAMSLATEDFEDACEAILGRECSGLTRKHLVRPDAALMFRLVRLHEMAGQMAASTPDILALPEVARSLEQEMIHVMIRCLADGEALGMTAGGRRHDAIVARFEEFLEANPDTPLYLTEICAGIAVSERTLRVACEEHLGMGPIRYLSLRRMHLVRRALLQADAAATTVTRIATDHGFWELGRFSVAYRNLFGEQPSQTLRRPAEHTWVVLNRPSSLASPVLHS